MSGARAAVAGAARAAGARYLGTLLTLVCAAGFLLWARHQPAPHLPSSPAGIVALALGVLAYAVATLGLCERSSVLLRRHAPRLARRASYRPMALGQLGNVFLPARGGDAIRIALVSTAHAQLSVGVALRTILAERALDIGCHAALLVTVLLGLFGPTVGTLGRLPVVALWLALLAGAVPLARRSVRVRARTRAVALSLVMWLGEIAGWWAASHATGLDLGFLQAAYVFAIASLALVMPVGFGSIGTLDAGILLAVRTLGLQTAAVLGFVVLLRVLFVLPSLALVAALRPADAVRAPTAPRRLAARWSARRRQVSARARGLRARPRP